MVKLSPPSLDVLIQFRLPRALADRLRVRAAEVGAPLTQWIREVLVRELSPRELSGWLIDAPGKSDDPQWLTWERGQTNPHCYLVVEGWAGDSQLSARVRGGPAQGKAPTEL